MHERERETMCGCACLLRPWRSTMVGTARFACMCVCVGGGRRISLYVYQPCTCVDANTVYQCLHSNTVLRPSLPPLPYTMHCTHSLTNRCAGLHHGGACTLRAEAMRHTLCTVHIPLPNAVQAYTNNPNQALTIIIYPRMPVIPPTSLTSLHCTVHY